MIDKEKQRQEELEHFRYCQAVIRGNVTRYEQEYQERHRQAQELYKSVNSGDVELYNQLMTTLSLEEQAQSGLRKNRAALEKPYFGRIDYTDLKPGRQEKVYIGKNGVFQNKTDVLIADWRAPISSVYYENELGKGEYQLPDETVIPVDLKLKRTYDVSEGRLNGYYDSDVASNDELLVKYLSRNKDAVLGEIIATIQKEQNTIIRKSPFCSLIVQGVAGSGKTTVAMHRISYLLYNYKERFESNEFCIVGSNDLLLNYITSGLPELDVPNIKHMRMDQLLARLCEKDLGKKLCITSPDSSASGRCTLAFMQKLELYLMNLREALVDCRPLSDSQIGTILSESGNLTLLRENPSFSINRLLATMDERVKTRIRFLMSGGDRDELQAMLRRYAGYYKARRPRASIHELYLDFLTKWNVDQEASGSTVQKTSGGSVQKAAGSSVQKAANGSVQKAASGSVQKATGGSVQKATDGTVQKATDGAVLKAANGTVLKVNGSAVQKTTDGTVLKVNDSAVPVTTENAVHRMTGSIVPEKRTYTAQEAHLNDVRNKRYDLYDLAALALIHYRVTQKKPNEEFGLIFLDEAQDFGLSVFYVLRTLLPNTYFTIMGDVSQNINYDTGINDWYDLTRLFLTGPRDEFLLLQKSYRNTIEISEYAGKILEKASSGRYKITPVIRHGLPVSEEQFWSEPELAERCAAVLLEAFRKGLTTAAVICRDEQSAGRARQLLDGLVPLADEEDNYSAGVMLLPIRMVKGLEFDTVVLWNPDMKNGLNHPAQAKLLYVAATRALHELYVFTC